MLRLVMNNDNVKIVVTKYGWILKKIAEGLRRFASWSCPTNNHKIYSYNCVESLLKLISAKNVLIPKGSHQV